jgi:hypothetical protein
LIRPLGAPQKMEETVPRGLCIRRKDKNRKQSITNYITNRIPRQSITSKAEQLSLFVPTLIQQVGSISYVANHLLCQSDCFTPSHPQPVTNLPGTIPSVPLGTDTPASHPTLREESPRQARSAGSETSNCWLRPNRYAEVIN